jgi:hypothetical protein
MNFSIVVEKIESTLLLKNLFLKKQSFGVCFFFAFDFFSFFQKKKFICKKNFYKH